ncbi:late secretory pathway protein avl9 [Nowakowskiella sp. JEL0407]|nr:late secretory pathway protein avl9 [Nowakowskiella sp. JEL0407]
MNDESPEPKKLSPKSALSSSYNLPTIVAVLCVGFHHRNGPQLEYAIPRFPLSNPASFSTPTEDSRDLGELTPILPDEWSILPFLCLPDGAHMVEFEEFIYFHLPPIPRWSPHVDSSLFGLACFRQMDSNNLINKTKDVTRSMVQKAVVVLARHPILGSLRSKLGLVTHAFFEQRDFEKREILDNFYEALTTSVTGYIPDSTLYMAFSLRDLIYQFKSKTLQLFKLLLLEKRVLFFGQKVEKLSAYQYAVVSLIPGLLRSLGDAASPILSSTEEINTPTEPTNEKDYKYGLPLRIFGEGCFFQPYIPLQQIDVLMSPTTRSFLVGTSNAIFTHHKGCNIDVVVNVDTGMIEIMDPVLTNILNLTPADRKFIEDITKSVTATWINEEDPSMNTQIDFEGSDDDIRGRFELYLLSLIKSVLPTSPSATTPPVSQSPPPEHEQQQPVRDYISEFNSQFVKAWKATANYAIWKDKVTANPDGMEILIPGHPNAGASTLAAMQLNWAAKIQEMGLDKTFFVARKEVTKALTGAEKVVRDIAADPKAAAQGTGNAVTNWFSSLRTGWTTPSATTSTETSPTITTRPLEDKPDQPHDYLEVVLESDHKLNLDIPK